MVNAHTTMTQISHRVLGVLVASANPLTLEQVWVCTNLACAGKAAWPDFLEALLYLKRQAIVEVEEYGNDLNPEALAGCWLSLGSIQATPFNQDVLLGFVTHQLVTDRHPIALHDLKQCLEQWWPEESSVSELVYRIPGTVSTNHCIKQMRVGTDPLQWQLQLCRSFGVSVSAC